MASNSRERDSEKRESIHSTVEGGPMPPKVERTKAMKTRPWAISPSRWRRFFSDSRVRKREAASKTAFLKWAFKKGQEMVRSRVTEEGMRRKEVRTKSILVPEEREEERQHVSENLLN